ncbi:hypothetical protein DDZ16_10180 [Marinilabilia rubra]|uniref:Uncharacterized protein n=1 Tax=Marinilabilia rubra TaxID=2162893 RepID=A0A2U2B8H4_9BACT|nr:hypothetical protein DDZ16_10180 [Marinilabilia rubra]
MYSLRHGYLKPSEASSYIFMNPTVPQSETATTLSSQVKKIKTHLGSKTITNTESTLQNLSIINTRVFIGKNSSISKTAKFTTYKGRKAESSISYTMHLQNMNSSVLAITKK